MFTSLHTTSAVGAVSRLLHLGVEPFLLASAVQGVIAQRLVRRVCAHCADDREYDKTMLDALGLERDEFPNCLTYGSGCPRCADTGYKGRTGLYEVFRMNPEFRQMIAGSYDESRLAVLAARMGMESLIEDGRQKVLDGLTTLDELLRVLGPSTKNDYVCRQCGVGLEPKFCVCPFCGTVQRAKCRDCGSWLETEWMACPYCGSPTPWSGGKHPPV